MTISTNRLFQFDRSLFTKLALLIIFAYTYNHSIRGFFYSSKIIDVGIIFLSLGLLFAGTISAYVRPRRFARICAVCGIFLAFVLVRNGDMAHGNFGMPLNLCWAAAFLFLLNNQDDWLAWGKKLFCLFSAEHIFFTWFFYVFRNLYLEKVVVKFEVDTMWLLRYQFTHGQYPGITFHTSANGIYLGIATIFFFCFLMDDFSKKKWFSCNAILFLFSLGALLLTGKRGHLLFGMAAIAVLYIIRNKRTIPFQIIQLFYIGAAGIAAMLVLALFIPELMTTFSRIAEMGENSDITNGRLPMYALAVRYWSTHPLLGTGWGTYKYIYADNIVATDGYALKDAHNVYIQLLCETGIVGILFFLTLFFALLVFTVRLELRVQDNRELSEKYSAFLLFSCGIQLFFLMYCLSGNALYDIPIMFPYAICLTMALSVHYRLTEPQQKECSLCQKSES